MRAERFRVVSVLDEDLQLTLNERIDYGNSRDFDRVVGKAKPGGRPTIYHVRQVPHVLWEEYVDAPDSFAEKYKRAFMCGVELVENLMQLDGVSLGKWSPSTRNTRADAVIMDESDLRLFSPAERAEIGSVIYTHSFLPLRTAATYLLLRSLLEPLTNLDARLAAASQSAAAPMPSGAHSGQATPDRTATDNRSGMRDADSASPTHAPAAESVI